MSDYKYLNEKGKIPANTTCPFRSGCVIAQTGNCYHKGKDHKVDFPCATARLFDLLQRNKDYGSKT